MEKKPRTYLLRIFTPILAVALMTGFIAHRHRTGKVLHSVHTTTLPIDSPDVVVLDTVRAHPDPLGKNNLVLDIFGGGGMITLDSLHRRVERQRMVLYSSKTALISNPHEQEWLYLDSLLKAKSIKP